MSKNLNGSFFTTKSLNGENEVDINNLIAESAQIDDLSCSQLEIGDLNVIAKFGSVDNSINLLQQSIDDLSSNLDISCSYIDVSLNANIVDLSCTDLVVHLNANIADLTCTGTKDFTTGLLQMGSTIMNSNIVGNSHNIAGLNNITSTEGTIDTLTNTNFNTIDISCRHLHIENEFSNERYITFEDDYSRDIASFTGKLISGINSDAIDLSMVGYAGGTTTEILLSTDPDTNSYIDVANFGIGTKTPSTKLEVSGTIKGNDLTITNDITCNNDITCDNDLDVDGIGTFKDVVVTDTGTTGGSIELTGELTINTPGFYGGTSGLKVNNVSYFNSNVGIGVDAASNPLHIATSGQDYIFNDKQLYFNGNPATTNNTPSGGEKRRIVADSVGGEILFKLLNRLGVGDTESIELFNGNITRNPGINVENTDYKGTRLIVSHPDITASNSSDAFSFKMYGNTSTTATGEVDIDYEGNIFGNNFPTPSDITFKENIVDANITNLISDFQKVRFVNFNMIDDYKKLKRLGVIAQELKDIYPSAIIEKNKTDDDDNDIGTKMYVKYEVLYLKCCVIVQELIKENETLKTRLDDLESRLSALEII